MSEEKQKKINLNIFKNIPKDETDTILDEDLFGREVKLDEKISDFIQVFKSKWLESQTYFVNIVKKKKDESVSNEATEEKKLLIEEEIAKDSISEQKQEDKKEDVFYKPEVNNTFASLLKLKRTLTLQKELSYTKPIPNIIYRKKQLVKIKSIIEKNIDKIVVAQNKDFGLRHSSEVLKHEVILPLALIKLTIKELKKWTNNQHNTNTNFFDQMLINKEIKACPYGCVGIINSWNFPFSSAFIPLISAIAAGNRVILNVSSKTLHVSRLIQKIIVEEFDDSEISVIIGDEKITRSFGLIKFDKLFYSGDIKEANGIVKSVEDYRMPIHFECSEMTPAIVGNKANIKHALKKIIHSKVFNSGQHSDAPDYILVKNTLFDEFLHETKLNLNKLQVKGVLSTPTYIINKDHYDRLQSYMVEIKQKGIQTIQYPLKNIDNGDDHLMFPLTFVIDPTVEMKVLNEEIFGPIVSVIRYVDFPDAINYINQKNHSKSIYFFGNDSFEQNYLLNHCKVKTITFNNALIDTINYTSLHHLSNDEITHLYGEEGFLEFSKLRTIFKNKTF